MVADIFTQSPPLHHKKASYDPDRGWWNMAVKLLVIIGNITKVFQR